MKRRFALAVAAALSGFAVSQGWAQSGDPDRIERQEALGHASAIENAWRSVEARIGVTDAGDLWEADWDGLSDPPVGDWWLQNWTDRGLTARYCAGVLAVYAVRDELKGVGREHRAVQVAPYTYGGGRTGLQLILRDGRLYEGSWGRQGGSLPGCMPAAPATGDRVALVGGVDDPKLTPTGVRWRNEDRTQTCPAPDTGTFTERRRIPVQTTALTNCPGSEPNCNDLIEHAGSPPAWPADCAARETMLAVTPDPELPLGAACSDWVRWESNCQIVYAQAQPPTPIQPPSITWEPGPVHRWTTSCSCSCQPGQIVSGGCTRHWAQNTEWRVFVLRPGEPEMRSRYPARVNGQPRLVNTASTCSCTPPPPVNPNSDPDPVQQRPDDDDGTGEGPGEEGNSNTETETGVPEQDTVSDPNFGGPVDAPEQGNANGGGDGKPIILDLDGDGVELVPLKDSTARFDINGDGYRERMAWAAPDDGFLVYDRDADGVIGDRDELSFMTYVENAETDLEGLRHFDTDRDGRLDPDDAEWGLFRVWQDLDQDGESDPGELRTLDAAGIRLIELTSDSVKREVAGGTVYGEGRYVGLQGPRAFWDVMLRTGPRLK